jgi:hypothetical protein
MRPVMRYLAGGVALLLACSTSESRTGVLAAVADSTLPRSVETKCTDLEERSTMEGKRNRACQAQIGDTLTTVVTSPDRSAVVRVTQRWRPIGDATAARTQLEQAYDSRFGQGERICTGSTYDLGRRWRAADRVVTLASYAADSTLELSITSEAPGFGQPCP